MSRHSTKKQILEALRGLLVAGNVEDLAEAAAEYAKALGYVRIEDLSPSERLAEVLAGLNFAGFSYADLEMVVQRIRGFQRTAAGNCCDRHRAIGPDDHECGPLKGQTEKDA